MYKDVDTNGTWTRSDTAGQPINLGEYLSRNKVSYVFPAENRESNKLNIDKEGLFIMEAGFKAFIMKADELEGVIGMPLWDARIVDVYVPESQLISNLTLYYVMVEAGDACCFDTDFARRIVVITKARMGKARRELEKMISENISG